MVVRLLTFISYSVVLVLLCSQVQAKENCDAPEDICIAQSVFEQADAQMTKTYETVLAKIKNHDFDDYMVDPANIEKSLKYSQETWFVYRDAQCESVFALMSGGTSRQVDQLECLSELTYKREEELRKVYNFQ